MTQRVISVVVLWCIAVAAWTAEPVVHQTVVLVQGAAGDEQYAGTFTRCVAAWRAACTQAQAELQVIGVDAVAAGETANDKATLEATLTTVAATPSTAPLWVVFIGHGTWDGRAAKFNLRGPDVTTSEVAAWLDRCQRPVVVLNSASASAPFVQALSRPGRVIISATKSGNEFNATRFGTFVADVLVAPDADLDRDGQVSVLEIFLSAAHAVAASYNADGLIATEHALLDDNGDGRGTRADWFRGIHPTKAAAEGAQLDGLRAHQIHLVQSADEQRLSASQRAERDRLELVLADLRAKRASLSDDDYYRQLEVVLQQLAQVYAASTATPVP